MGVIMRDVIGEINEQNRGTKRRNSASERIQVPIYEEKVILKFGIDGESVTESERAKLLKGFELNRQKTVEWRSQHQEIKLAEEDPTDKKRKRAASEVKKVQENYLGAVKLHIKEDEVKKGKVYFE